MFRSVMNVSKEKDLSSLKKLERTDPQRFPRLQRNGLKDYPRATNVLLVENGKNVQA